MGSRFVFRFPKPAVIPKTAKKKILKLYFFAELEDFLYQESAKIADLMGIPLQKLADRQADKNATELPDSYPVKRPAKATEPKKNPEKNPECAKNIENILLAEYGECLTGKNSLIIHGKTQAFTVVKHLKGLPKEGIQSFLANTESVKSRINIYLYYFDTLAKKPSLTYLTSLNLPQENSRFLIILDYLQYPEMGKIIQLWGGQARSGVTTIALSLAAQYPISCYVNASGKSSGGVLGLGKPCEITKSSTGKNSVQLKLGVEKIPAQPEHYLATYLLKQLPYLCRGKKQIAYLDYSADPSKKAGHDQAKLGKNPQELAEYKNLLMLTRVLRRIFPVVVVDCGEMKRYQYYLENRSELENRSADKRLVKNVLVTRDDFSGNPQATGKYFQGLGSGAVKNLDAIVHFAMKRKPPHYGKENFPACRQIIFPYSWEFNRMQELKIDWLLVERMLPWRLKPAITALKAAVEK